MATHTWKSNASGFILDPTNYTDGQAFAPGDTLVASDGAPGASSSVGHVGTLTAGTYSFNVTGATGGLLLIDSALGTTTTLTETGPGAFEMQTFGAFVNDGTIDIGAAGTPKANGAVQVTMNDVARGGVVEASTFTNNGQILIQNHKVVKLFPNSTTQAVNSAGATITVKDGGGLVFSDYFGFVEGSTNSFRNDGLILVSGVAGLGGGGFESEYAYSGSGTLDLTGLAGGKPTNSLARFDGPASGTFDVASGELDFSGGGTVAGTINFYDNDALLQLEANNVTQSTASTTPLAATINGFQAGDQIFLNGYAAYESYAYDQTAHTLTLYSAPGGQGTVEAQLTLAGTYTTSDFTLQPVDALSPIDGLGVNSNSAVLITTTSTANALTAPALPTVPPPPAAPAASSVINSTANGDVVTAGAGNVVVYASGATATVNGGSGNLTFIAGGGAYAAGGGGGTDILYGGAGSDTLTGGAGASSIIVAGSGNTSLVGGAGSAALMFGGTADSSFAGSTGGNDTMVGGGGANAYAMTTGDIAFGGPAGPDSYGTGSGSALIVEGPGASTITLGSGSLVAFAGTGVDTYVVGKASGSASIVGFKPNDHITLAGGFTVNDAISALDDATTGSFGTSLGLSNGATLTLYGTPLSSISIGAG